MGWLFYPCTEATTPQPVPGTRKSFMLTHRLLFSHSIMWLRAPNSWGDPKLALCEWFACRLVSEPAFNATRKGPFQIYSLFPLPLEVHWPAESRARAVHSWGAGHIPVAPRGKPASQGAAHTQPPSRCHTGETLCAWLLEFPTSDKINVHKS